MKNLIMQFLVLMPIKSASIGFLFFPYTRKLYYHLFFYIKGSIIKLNLKYIIIYSKKLLFILRIQKNIFRRAYPLIEKRFWKIRKQHRDFLANYPKYAII